LLADFYWKILGVPPTPMFILPVEPKNAFIPQDKREICVIYSAGADRPFREYQYFRDVVPFIKDRYLTIQLGGHDDYLAEAEVDLRGKLTYREEAFVVSKASLGLTVDTFGAHLCGAMGIPQVTLPGSSNGNVVRPKQIKGEQIVLSPDYIKVCLGLGPCSAQIRNCPLPCIGSIEPSLILDAINQIERTR
jgi:ADP-heptose:LPS heptosyltransferase